MTLLVKKPAAKECKDHRTISLIFNALKIMLKILKRRPENKIPDANGKDQFGFIKKVEHKKQYSSEENSG